MALTAATSRTRPAGSARPSPGAPSGASCWPATAPITSRSIRVTPGRVAAAGSMSRGNARSSSTSGARPAAVRACVTCSSIDRVITTPAAPVQEITRSAACMCCGISCMAADAPPWIRANRTALSGVRFATTMPAAPNREAVTAASALIDPAPTISTRPSRSGASCGPGAGSRAAARRRPTLTRLGPAWAMPVSAGARFAARRARGGGAPPRGPAERLPDLAEDLALADDHRVQPARDGEQVLHGAVFVEHVQVRREVGQRDARVPGEQFADRADAAVELVHLGVDFHPVAGGDDEGARHVLGVEHVVPQLVEFVPGYRGALERGHRGALVAQPHHQHAHRPTASTGGRALAALRWAWKARICNSMDRSTLRTSTWSGTVSTTGAKLRMLVTPTATSRSHTPWAVPAGVAITPMDTWCRRTTASIVSACCTASPAIMVPTIAGSESSRAAMRKPREAKPP